MQIVGLLNAYSDYRYVVSLLHRQNQSINDSNLKKMLYRKKYIWHFLWCQFSFMFMPWMNQDSEGFSCFMNPPNPILHPNDWRDCRRCSYYIISHRKTPIYFTTKETVIVRNNEPIDIIKLEAARSVACHYE